LDGKMDFFSSYICKISLSYFFANRYSMSKEKSL
jgi:hypothetical protein